MGKLAFQLDRLACRSADLVLLDTAAQQQYFAGTFGLPLSKLSHLYVSCNEAMFYPRPQEKSGDQFTVLSYSSYLPLHGVEDIVKAAKILAGHPDIRFRLIGRGQTYPVVHQLADRLQVNNIDFVLPVPYHQLPLEIAQADLGLAGPFGRTDKARRVIPGKLFQFLAMARPTIAGDTPANRELLTNHRDAWLLPSGQPEALAAAILVIKQDDTQRESLAAQGYRCYQTQASEQIVGQKLYQLIEMAAKAGGSSK
jgi:glycosyltransferase involved in cell wall biosynthesis